MPGKKIQKCKHCGTPDTPCWRKIEGDTRALYCNRCALFHKRHGRHRPLGVEVEDEEDYEFCPAEEIITEGEEAESVEQEVKEEEAQEETATATTTTEPVVKVEEDKKTKKNQKKTRKTKKSKERYEWEFSSFMCSECKREYRHLNSLKMHCKKAHNGKGWQKQYFNVTSQAYAKQRDFICPLCGVECATHLGLRRHMTAQHSDCAGILAPFYERKELCMRENKAVRDKVIKGDTQTLEDFLAKLGPAEEEQPRRRQHQKVKKAAVKVQADEDEDEEYIDLNAEASEQEDTDKENEDPAPEVSQMKLRPRRTKSEKKPLIDNAFEEKEINSTAGVKVEQPATPELLCKDETFVGVNIPLFPDAIAHSAAKAVKIKQEHVAAEEQIPELTSRKKRKRSPPKEAAETFFPPEKKQRVVQSVPAVYPSAIPQIAQIAPIIPGAPLAPVPLVAPICPIAPVPIIAPVGIEMVPYIPVYAPLPQPEDIFYNPELLPVGGEEYFGTTFESQPLPTLSGSPSVPTDMLCSTVSSLQTPQCGTTDLFDDMMELFEDAPLQIKVETEN